MDQGMKMSFPLYRLWMSVLLLLIFTGSALCFGTQKIIHPFRNRNIHQAALSKSCPRDATSWLQMKNIGGTDQGKDSARCMKPYVAQSIGVVVASRRLSFLFLSVLIVNFVRSTILKIPKSEKFMFDECPWPFTIAHDPMKFIKDRNTSIVAIWALLCQIYALLKAPL